MLSVYGSQIVPVRYSAHMHTISPGVCVRVRGRGIHSSPRGYDRWSWVQLNRVEVSMDDLGDRIRRSPTGLESLSSHHWRLLVKLTSVPNLHPWFAPHDVGMEVVRSFDEAEYWQKLGVWILIVWWPHTTGSR